MAIWPRVACRGNLVNKLREGCCGFLGQASLKSSYTEDYFFFHFERARHIGHTRLSEFQSMQAERNLRGGKHCGFRLRDYGPTVVERFAKAVGGLGRIRALHQPGVEVPQFGVV